MTVDYNDGKIHGWNGGECPVHPETLVNVWFRGSGYDEVFTAKVLRWSHNHNDGDVIAFRVNKVFKEPKTIWVNEYVGGEAYVYASEEKAKFNSGVSATRIAVKYQ